LDGVPNRRSGNVQSLDPEYTYISSKIHIILSCTHTLYSRRLWQDCFIKPPSLCSLLHSLFDVRQKPLSILISSRPWQREINYRQRDPACWPVFPGTASSQPLPFLFRAKCNNCFCSSAVHTDPVLPFLSTFPFFAGPSSLESESLLGSEDDGYGRDSTLTVGLVGVRGIVPRNVVGIEVAS
jgi:hypothetical protein